MEWEKVKERIESRGCLCKHNGGRMIIDNIDLSCCKGTATSCKPPEFLFLINLLRNKCEEIDNLRAQVDKLQDKPTTFYNKCTINNVQMNGLSLLDSKRKGENIYNAAFYQLQSCSSSEEKTRLLKLLSSSDPSDQINYKLEIMNIISEAIEKDADKIPKIEFYDFNKSIEAEQEILTNQGLQLGMYIEEIN